MKGKSIAKLAVTLVVIVLVALLAVFGLKIPQISKIYGIKPVAEAISLGLDLRGGIATEYIATDTTVEDFESLMESTVSALRKRLTNAGFTEANVARQGTDRIRVEIPGVDDHEEVVRIIGTPAHLEFRDPSGNVVLEGKNIVKAYTAKDSTGSNVYPYVYFELDDEGTKAFAEATEDLAPTKGQIVIILDGEVQSAPAVQSVISDGNVSITGGYTLDAAKQMKTVLESGSLPVSFEYAQSQVVGPTLGQDALQSGVLVALIGLVIVMIYLLVFYEGLGIITAAAMAVFAAIYLGILALLSAFGLFSLSMAGIAGVVLTIGMAADSSILTLERFREEIRMGRSVRAASITGVRHGILTSIDADLVTLVSALTLFFLASA